MTTHPPPRRILLASNLTSRVDRALDRAVQLAGAWKAELHVVHAVQEAAPSVPFGVDPDLYLRAHRDPKALATRQLERDLASIAPQAKLHVEGDAAPAEAIIAVAEREGCELIVLGETRERLMDLREGTVDQIMRMSPVSVLAVRARATWPYRHLLVGTDFTDEARQALEVAAELFPDATIHLIHAYAMPYASVTEDTPEGREWAGAQLAKLREEIRAARIPAARRVSIHPSTEAGPPGPVLRQVVIDHGADLTVIGAHPRGLLFDAVVGNSRRIVGAIPGDVLVVRATGRPA